MAESCDPHALHRMHSGRALPVLVELDGYHVVDVIGDVGGTELAKCRAQLLEVLDLRQRYQRCRDEAPADPPPSPTAPFAMEDGVVLFEGQRWRPIPFWQYARDIDTLQAVVEDGPARSACRKRLSILSRKCDLHRYLNGEKEDQLCSQTGLDVFTAHKVDNSVRLATAMNAHDFTEFIKQKAESDADEVVVVEANGRPVTLQELIEEVGIADISSLSVQTTGLMPSPAATLHRHFDIFSRRRPRGREQAVRLLKLFLRVSRHRKGQYFAELVRPILTRPQRPTVTVSAQYNVFMLGNDSREWQRLAEWMAEFRLHTPHNRWVIRIPCVQEIRDNFLCDSMQTQLDNLFLPLWEASAAPEKHPALAAMLAHTVAFNVFPDEPQLRPDAAHLPRNRLPESWAWDQPPPDALFNYYIWANVESLNYYRSLRGLNTFHFVPNCGEVDASHHLASAFLLGHAIAGGACMRSLPVLQYLYYLAGVGVYCSPLASNAEHVPYRENPFPEFLKVGLRVSLCTSDPLHYHHTREPILEEYGAAGKIFKLSVMDLCEVALHSVLTSSFSDDLKAQWLGQRHGPEDSEPCSFRVRFREKTLREELGVLHGPASGEQLRFTLREFAREHPNVEEYISFSRFHLHGQELSTSQSAKTSGAIRHLLQLRQKYIFRPPARPWEPPVTVPATLPADFQCELVNGVAVAYDAHNVPGAGRTVPLAEFIADWQHVQQAMDDVDLKTLAHWRLLLLEGQFDIYKQVNGEEEEVLAEEGEHRDFYQTHKVDTHVHMAAGMTAKELLKFIVEKAQHHDHDLVRQGPAGPITLGELFEELNINVAGLTVNALDVQADNSVFERFDYFNGKYRPLGNAELRDLFLKQDNYMGGRYFAELVKGVFSDMEKDAFTFAENRISIYGKHRTEWSKLANWYDVHGMWHRHNRWLVQVPRIYPVLHAAGAVHSFSELLANVFLPLWEVSIDPSKDLKLAHFMEQFSGFDCVDNESAVDCPFTNVPPEEWITGHNPSYHYWAYYMWANIYALNTFRASRGQSTFSFRPHCGESGSVSHLSSAFLLADGIAHGINLRLSDSLQYLFYLAQIPIAVSPLSNNSLFLDIHSNPFPTFFKRGLSVSLSTDDPLQFHHTQEPLVEEYSIASKVWRLDPTDLCEIARNSVLHSGFPHDVKKSWLGKLYFLNSSVGNKASMSHVANIRAAFRFEMYHAEVDILEAMMKVPGFPRSLMTLKQEDKIIMDLFGLTRDEFLRTHHRRASVQGDAILCCPKSGVVVKGKAALPFCHRCETQLVLAVYDVVQSRNYGRLFWRCPTPECQADGQGVLIAADDERLLAMQRKVRLSHERSGHPDPAALAGSVTAVFP
eukprot:EG_transcript_646